MNDRYAGFTYLKFDRPTERVLASLKEKRSPRFDYKV